jgi:hypothetical protein
LLDDLDFTGLTNFGLENRGFGLKIVGDLERDSLVKLFSKDFTLSVHDLSWIDELIEVLILSILTGFESNILRVCFIDLEGKGKVFNGRISFCDLE